MLSMLNLVPVAARNLSSLEKERLVISSLRPLKIYTGLRVPKSHMITGASGVLAFREPT